MLEMTLCQIIKGKKLLLKKATRGVSIGKWNALGGKVDKGESARACAVREVREESGLKIRNIESCGTIEFYKGSRRNGFIRMHLFLSTSFEGRMRSGEEGKLKWFNMKGLPYSQMWDDDLFWMPLFLKGYRFDAEFIYDSDMRRVRAYTLRNVRKLGTRH